MPTIDRERVDYSCPNCGRDVDAEYRQFWSGSREVQCRRCRTKVKFDASLASRARREADDVDRAQNDLAKALQRLFTEKVEVTKG